MVRKRNRRYGGAIAETGPALFFFFICVFFPMMDVLYMLAGYGFGWYLHSTEIRECSVRNPNGSGPSYVQKADDDFFNRAGGLAAFLGYNAGNRSTMISHVGPIYTPGQNGLPGEVTLTTNFQIRPWLYIPFLPNVPGVSANIPVSITTVKQQEENGSNG